MAVSFAHQCFWQRDFSIPDIEHTDEAKILIQRNPELREDLNSIVKNLKRFYASFSLFLESVYNPEDGNNALLLSIITKDTADEAYNKLLHFKEQFWWNSNLKIKSVLTINSVALG